MKKIPLIVIAGATASGKTALSINIAKKFGGEIVSADSMQIYRGMAIGTALPTEEEKCGVAHHLLEIVKPSKKFSAALYQKRAFAAIEDILRQYEAGKFYRWGITEKGDDSLIGIIGLVRLNEETNEGSFAYLLGCDYWNKGYGTEVLKEVFRFAFEELELERIVADHMAENPASGTVMKKAGMHYIRTVGNKYEKNGIWHDAVEYTITAPDWKKIQGS